MFNITTLDRSLKVRIYLTIGTGVAYASQLEHLGDAPPNPGRSLDKTGKLTNAPVRGLFLFASRAIRKVSGLNSGPSSSQSRRSGSLSRPKLLQTIYTDILSTNTAPNLLIEPEIEAQEYPPGLIPPSDSGKSPLFSQEPGLPFASRRCGLAGGPAS